MDLHDDRAGRGDRADHRGDRVVHRGGRADRHGDRADQAVRHDGLVVPAVLRGSQVACRVVLRESQVAAWEAVALAARPFPAVHGSRHPSLQAAVAAAASAVDEIQAGQAAAEAFRRAAAPAGAACLERRVAAGSRAVRPAALPRTAPAVRRRKAGGAGRPGKAGSGRRADAQPRSRGVHPWRPS